MVFILIVPSAFFFADLVSWRDRRLHSRCHHHHHLLLLLLLLLLPLKQPSSPTGRHCTGTTSTLRLAKQPPRPLRQSVVPWRLCTFARRSKCFKVECCGENSQTRVKLLPKFLQVYRASWHSRQRASRTQHCRSLRGARIPSASFFFSSETIHQKNRGNGHTNSTLSSPRLV